ncbi:ABC transporter permease [Dethiobacter alkaliphilus]|uniref:ABC transporter permease n=1 Tax=Dethiobacter alkaliphilus TaxID=427926 RepID=UPI00222753F5|nr:ABC transporter permease [Dethiobacter alkaliphilus]MCW3488513.1 ABC transporter permease [Dethiobacter alkaliphilus]
MTFCADLFALTMSRQDLILGAMLQHLRLSATALGFILLLGIPLGIIITRVRKLAPVIIGITGFLYTIPVLAFFGFVIPVLGIGERPALVALVIYGLLPLVRNTFVGITEVDKSVIDAARGMGATNLQLLRDVEIPLALPTIVAGFRTVTVMTISIATIAAFIGAGGLGTIILRGITTYHPELILAGAIPVAFLAITADSLLGLLEKSLLKRESSGKQKRPADTKHETAPQRAEVYKNYTKEAAK